MSDTTRAAWIGGIFVVAVGVGTLFAQPIISEWLGPKHEGVFSVEQTCFSAKNLDSTVASQVTSFPCQLRIAHIDGPAAVKISVSLTSRRPLAEVRSERNDESAAPSLTANSTVLVVDVPVLRQGSVIDIRFLSKGEPSIERNVVRESGRLVTEASTTRSSRWQETWVGLLALVIAFILVSFCVIYLVYKNFLESAIGTIPPNQLLISLVAIVVTLVPFGIDNIVHTALLLAILHLVLNKK